MTPTARTFAALLLGSLAAACSRGSPAGGLASAPPATATPTPPPTTTSTAASGSGWIWGVTVDDPWRAAATAEAIGSLPRQVTARVVFDEGVAASEYVAPVRTIAGAGPVMGELLDSFAVSGVTVAQYRARAEEYVAALAPSVAIWEIGNEVNGEWLGASADVVAKLSAAKDVVRAAGGKTALTLYYNAGCWARPEHEMFRWVDENLPASARAGLDYVLVSYYEDDCNGLQPDWTAVFRTLAAEFPDSAIGFGECGTVDAAEKAAYLRRYYTARIDAPRFVGGYFWWYFSEDMVPDSLPLWDELRGILAAAP